MKPRITVMTARQYDPGGGPVEPPTASPAARDQAPRVAYDAGRHRIVARGVLDFAFADHFAGILDGALADHPERLVLDLTGVWLLDAGTVRILLAYQSRAAAAGCVLNIVGATGVVRRVLEITGVLPAATSEPAHRQR
jgi:anti-sigma B factor antagonist